MAESVLLADGSNQHSASVQLVSAREDHSSTAARALNTLLRTGGEERGGERGRKDAERDREGKMSQGGGKEDDLYTYIDINGEKRQTGKKRQKSMKLYDNFGKI